MTDGFAGTKPITTFVAGLITEAGPLTFPENASLDELNCVLERKGNRRRRKGIDFETDYETSSSDAVLDTVITNKAISYGFWKSVAGNGNRNYAVVQINKTLFFYDMSSQALSAGLKSFTVDIGDHAAEGATGIGDEPVSIDSGTGLCFVSGKKLKPFYIEYDPEDDTITETTIDLLIRDFEGVEDNLDPDEEPSTLSTEHHYNLKNQGWQSPGQGESDPITTYFSSKSKYPPNSKQWWTGKNSSDQFDANLLARFEAGNTLAPRGRFLVDPFNIDRNAVSGLTGLTTIKEDNRPAFVAFFASRVWYIGIESDRINGHVFFSQIVTRRDKIGKCYQEQDPTTEDLNELLPNDGGVVPIPELGNVKGVYVTDRFLFIFADNGVFSISGQGDESFTADSFAVNTVSDVGCVSGDSIVNAAGVVHWWSEDGIYRLAQDNVSGRFTAQSMTQQTIETEYLENIPALSKVYARGCYDSKTKRIFWHYASSAPSGSADRWKFDKVLIHDASFGVFYPWKVESLASDSPYIVGAIPVPAVVLSETTTNVTDIAGNNVTDRSSNVVTTTSRSTGARTVVDNTYVKWLIIVPNATDDNRWTFGEFSNTDFMDWYTKDTTGISYSSYLETGYELFGSLRNKQAPFINVFFERIEAAGATTALGGCLLRAKWDWTDDGGSGKWTTQEQVYRPKHELDKGIETAVPIGFPVQVKKHKIKGKGRALSLRFDSQEGLDFNLYGWEHVVEQNPSV